MVSDLFNRTLFFGSCTSWECVDTLDLLVSTANDLSDNTVLSESELDILENILHDQFPFMHGPNLGPLLETVVVQTSIPTGESTLNPIHREQYQLARTGNNEVILFPQTIQRQNTVTSMSTPTS